MQLPKELAPALWGAVGGAVVLAVLGFTWFGWVTSATAEAKATDRASAAVVAALAPICVEKFRASAEAAKNLAALKKVESWDQASYIEKGGWATLAGETKPYDGVAGACATALSTK